MGKSDDSLAVAGNISVWLTIPPGSSLSWNWRAIPILFVPEWLPASIGQLTQENQRVR